MVDVATTSEYLDPAGLPVWPGSELAQRLTVSDSDVSILGWLAPLKKSLNNNKEAIMITPRLRVTIADPFTLILRRTIYPA